MPSDQYLVETWVAALSRPGPQRGPLPAPIGNLRRLQDRVLAQALTHGLAPLVYRNLRALGLEGAFDAPALDRLKGAYYRTLADNLARFEGLRAFARQAGRQGIPAIVLKGPAIVHLVYGDPGLRPMDDIDLLVRPQDAPGARAILNALGYAPVPLYPDLFQRGKALFDLHTDPINRSRIEGRGAAVRFGDRPLWEGAQPLPGFAPLRMLGPADQALALAVHALKHGYQRKIWLVDIAGCLDRLSDAGAWARLRARARASGTTRILALTLYMLQSRLRRTLPPQVSSLAAACRPTALERRLLDLCATPGLPQLLEPLVLFRSIRGLRARIGYLSEAAFPKPAVLAQVTGLEGRRTFWLSYPFRLVQLAGMALRYAVRLIRGPSGGSN